MVYGHNPPEERAKPGERRAREGGAPPGFSYCPSCGSSLSALIHGWPGGRARIRYCPYCGSPIACGADSMGTVTRGKGRLVITKLGGPMAN